MAVCPLKVSTCNRRFFEGTCKSWVIPAIDGEYGILAGHEPVVVAVQPGSVRIEKEDGQRIHAVVGMGFVSITCDEVLLLVDTAELPEEIDERLAAQVVERAQEILLQKQSHMEHQLAMAAMARALSRLQGKGKFR